MAKNKYQQQVPAFLSPDNLGRVGEGVSQQVKPKEDIDSKTKNPIKWVGRRMAKVAIACATTAAAAVAIGLTMAAAPAFGGIALVALGGAAVANDLRRHFISSGKDKLSKFLKGKYNEIFCDKSHQNQDASKMKDAVVQKQKAMQATVDKMPQDVDMAGALQQVDQVNQILAERAQAMAQDDPDAAQQLSEFMVDLPDDVYGPNGEIDQEKLNAYMGLDADGNYDKDTVSPFMQDALQARAEVLRREAIDKGDPKTSDVLMREAGKFFVGKGLISQDALDSHVSNFKAPQAPGAAPERAPAPERGVDDPDLDGDEVPL